MTGSFRLGRFGKLIVREGDPDYVVRAGSVVVRLAPSRAGTPLRQMYLGCAGPGDTIAAPPAAPPDDGARMVLTLLIKADGGTATLEGRPHAQQVGDAGRLFPLDEGAGFEGRHVGPQSFWEHVLSRYEAREEQRGQEVADRIDRHQEARGSLVSMMRASYAGAVERIRPRVERQDGGIYDAAAFLCKVSGIEIASFDSLRRDFGEDYALGIDDIARRSGFCVREATLHGRWARRLETGFLGYVDGEAGREVVVAFPRASKACLFVPRTGETYPVTREVEQRLERQVLVFDRPFAAAPVTFREVARQALHEVSALDVAILLAATVLLSFVGVAISALTQTIYDDIIPRQRESLASVVGIVFVAALVANFLFAIARNLTNLRITQKATSAVQVAIFHRVFHLPERFFKGCESAEQAYRITQLSGTYTRVLSNVVSIALSLVFAIVYLRRMYRCSPTLTNIGLALAALGVLVVFVSGARQRRLSAARMRQTATVRSFLYQAFVGIGTIRMSGAEDAVLAQYVGREGPLRELEGRLDRIMRASTMAVTIASAVGSLLMYWLVGAGQAQGITLGAFMGFVAANGMFSAQVLAGARDLSAVIAMLPVLKDTGELLMTRPESGQGRVLPDLRGDIRLQQVSFGYPGSGRLVLEDVSLHIRPGEYVGIVGASGCGKSTLLRLLLGFETADAGQILYDGVEVSKLDPVELRRRMGAVLQDGALVSGTILQNIRIVHPDADRAAVEAAVEMVGLTAEIEAMPMGLMTHVSEDALTISGGQKQRILIARAILGSPRILLFDEATSSLDNLAQERISEALAGLRATRVVVAHRLSTVRLCDRIVVLKDGHVQEEGSYDELMGKRGTFYEMVKVQQAV